MIKREKNNLPVIYIVDSDSLHQEMLVNKFETTTKYKVFTFETGEDFLEHFIKISGKKNKNKNQIVVLDYLLKKREKKHSKDGLEVLKLIKDISPQTEVIMYSEFDDIDIASSSIAMGAYKYIIKNENSFYRISNLINCIISEKELVKKRQQSIYSLILFLAIVGIVSLATFILYKINPEFF